MAQIVRMRISVRVRFEGRIIGRVPVNDLEDVFATARAVWRRDEPFDVEPVRVHQEVDHRLEVVGVGATDIGGDDDARPLTTADSGVLGNSPDRGDQHGDGYGDVSHECHHSSVLIIEG